MISTVETSETQRDGLTLSLSEYESCTLLLKNINKFIEMSTRRGTFLGNQHLTNLLLSLLFSDGVICLLEPSAITNLHVDVSTVNIPHSFILGRI